MMVAAGVFSVDLVVSTHNRARLRALDRDLESKQIGLAVRVGIDDRVQPMTVGFVAVQRVVLERRDDALALDSIDGFGAKNRGMVGILGVILEVPAVARVAREIDPARELNVKSSNARFPADCLAA